MLRELLSLFKSHDAIARMGEDFTTMLGLTRELVLMAGRHFFEDAATADERTDVARRDVKVNKLERRIRKEVITHLTLGGDSLDAPYCLLLMSLVKDVERIGDYAKNVSEVHDEGGAPVPDDENGAELREIRRIVEVILNETEEVFDASDAEQATALTQQGRQVAKRCDRLLSRVAAGPYDAATTTTLVLGARYYKRIAAHLLNILSGIMMPLHKLDYFDEDELPPGLEESADEED